MPSKRRLNFDGKMTISSSSRSKRLTFVSLADQASWLVLAVLGIIESTAKALHVMAVHNDCIEAKSSHPISVDFHLMTQSSGLALTKTVDIQDGHEVVQLVVAGKGSRLPNTALSGLTITHHAEHTIAVCVCVCGGGGGGGGGGEEEEEEEGRGD